VWDDPELPRWVGELYLEYHRGTYTSQAWIKHANRRNELLYREAELWAACGAFVDASGAGLAAQQTDLNAGWRTLLFNQFHDILPGSSIHQVYVDARADHQAIADRGVRVRDAALARLHAAVETGAPALVVTNPAPFAREDPVEARLAPGQDPAALTDDTGRAVTTQHLDGDGQEARVLVAATAPPLGYRAYPLGTQAPGEGGDETLQVTRDLLENRFFRVRLDERAEIVSLLDKRTGREVIAPGETGNRLIAFEDRPLNFDAWDINIYYTDKPYPVDDVASWRVVETGPLRGAA